MIRPAVMIYIRFPPSQCNVEDHFYKSGIEITREAVLLWQVSRV
jgi:hypothetical protein